MFYEVWRDGEKMKPKQREIIGRFLRDAAVRFIQDEDKTP